MHTGPVSVPLLARAAPLRVDGVARTLGDAAVIGPARRAAFAGTLRWIPGSCLGGRAPRSPRLTWLGCACSLTCALDGRE